MVRNALHMEGFVNRKSTLDFTSLLVAFMFSSGVFFSVKLYFLH